MSFTEDQQKLLSAKLEPKFVKGRKQGSSNVQYVEGWHLIAEANRIFGFDNWTRETLFCQEVCRYPVEIGDKKIAGFKVGYEAKVRVIACGTAREGTGHGSGIARDLFDAIESAAKEAETDAMKRAMMTFGNPFGLALYDKTRENVGVNETYDEPPATPREILKERLTASLAATPPEQGIPDFVAIAQRLLDDISRTTTNFELDKLVLSQPFKDGLADLPERERERIKGIGKRHRSTFPVDLTAAG